MVEKYSDFNTNYIIVFVIFMKRYTVYINKIDPFRDG